MLSVAARRMLVREPRLKQKHREHSQYLPLSDTTKHCVLRNRLCRSAPKSASPHKQ
jgi:hypothetical protein